MDNLPPGLVFAPSTGIVSSTATVAGSFIATVRATNPFNQSAQSSLLFVIAPIAPSSPLVLMTPLYDCRTGAFTFRSSGGNGSAVEYDAVGITGPTAIAGPYVVRPANDAQPFVLKARQSGIEVSYLWDFKVVCAGSGRVGTESEQGWAIWVEGNPVRD